MEYPPEFFDLNLRFARRAAELARLDLPEALLRHTHLYLAFGLGRDFDPAHPAWRDFLSGLASAADPVEHAYQAYRRGLVERPRALPEIAFGCFNYALWSGGRVRLHFFNAMPGESPLRRQHVPERLNELKAMFAHIQASLPGARSVVGGSWLYNLESYRRLFPAEFLQTAVREDPPETQFSALWGQFLDHAGQVKPELAAGFLRRVEAARDLPALLGSFPYPVLRLEAPVEMFHRFYRLEDAPGPARLV